MSYSCILLLYRYLIFLIPHGTISLCTAHLKISSFGSLFYFLFMSRQEVFYSVFPLWRFIGNCISKHMYVVRSNGSGLNGLLNNQSLAVFVEDSIVCDDISSILLIKTTRNRRSRCTWPLYVSIGWSIDLPKRTFIYQLKSSSTLL